ncbi:hypothetical protein P3T37_007437 [Kitasatospora sp. MAA4]|uniref:hypothetical protein n=1 Tax=Kitasatospora sp. MAA4 TaxID=3035093 RepID=UPI002476BC2E|nr:hypothetical protein [Kitasatospora sp. MAA4]MDH6137994.1 hypothetical protein [Kitasatospora sp. MAA4]
MTRTTPPRPLDIEAIFPELADYRGTTTRLHPRPGAPDASASSVGGPLLWPADEPWPVCTAPHGRGFGRRLADVNREREITAARSARGHRSPLTEEERRLLDELRREHRAPQESANDPVPMLALAQVYRRDVPDLPVGPGDCDLLQVFWCPFDRHGPTGYGMELDLRWRRSWEAAEVLVAPPQPQLVGFEGYVPEPCGLHPEQVVTYPFAGLLPEDLCARIDAWEDALMGENLGEEDEEAEESDEERAEPVGYQYDLSIPPGWRVGGFASWHTTDPYPMDCPACATPMELLLTVDSSEWDGGSGSWTPAEDRGLTPHPFAKPTGVTVGRWGELNIFACPTDPEHPHCSSIQ